MNRQKIHWCVDWCVVILFLMCVLGTTTNLYLWDKVFHIAPLIIFVTLGILFLNHISIKECFRSKDKEFYLMSGGILLSGINMILVHSRVGAIFTIADFLLILYLADKVCFDKIQIRVIVATCFLSWFYWQFINKDVFGNTHFNSNTPPIFMLSFFFIFISYVLCFWPARFQFSKWFYHIIAVLCAVLLAKRAMDFRCRGVVLALIAWVFTYFFLPKKKATIPLVIGLSLLFPALYVLISQSGAVDGVIVYGKNFSSGREIIWSEFFKVFIHHPITGIGSNFDLMLPNLLPQILRATHHALLDLLFVHGVPVFLIVLYLMHKRTEKIITSSSGLARNVCLASVYGSLTIGTFENIYILSPYNMMFLMIFIIYHRYLLEQTTIQESQPSRQSS